MVEEAREECLKYTDKAVAVSVDVSDEQEVRSGVGKVLELFGRADILVNNAGIETRYKPGESIFGNYFDTLTPEEYLKFFKIHTLGHYLMNLAVIPEMQKNSFGRIVSVTSVLGLNGAYSTPAYTASKAGAICQTKAFAKKYGRYNITVNAVAPGMVDTPMKVDASPEEYAGVARMTPLGRVAQPVDVGARRAVLRPGEPVCDGPDADRRRRLDGVRIYTANRSSHL